MAAAAARSTPPRRVPAPQVALVILLLFVVLVCAPCGAGARPVREGVRSHTDNARARTSPALDVGRWASGSVATGAGAHRVATVGGGAPTPPSGPSQNHN
ncbi:hypothetical protein PAHAL_1G044500 [Panicum hallii]|uniref:Uncharacterized protein n=1 Tax=Panicum hallii TaxID=206008 RepID=A0A2T8KTZ0_9POAL|nr:hypothetical protein PAHAL_1G044500 [Panicum hallii]